MKQRVASALSAACLAIGLLVSACDDGSKDQPTPYEKCRADGVSQCCGNDECGQGRICDFDYICSPAPGGGLMCGGGGGTHTCLALCLGDGSCAEAGLTCQDLEQFQGSDAGQMFRVCRAP
jgi:hypothetical protein